MWSAGKAVGGLVRAAGGIAADPSGSWETLKERAQMTTDLAENISKIWGFGKEAYGGISAIIQNPLWIGEGLALMRAHQTCDTIAAFSATSPVNLQTVIHDCLEWAVAHESSVNPTDQVLIHSIDKFREQETKPLENRNPTCLTMMKVMVLLSDVQLDEETKKKLGQCLRESTESMQNGRFDREEDAWNDFRRIMIPLEGQSILPSLVKEYWRDVDIQNKRLDDHQLLNRILDSMQRDGIQWDTLNAQATDEEKERKALISKIKNVMMYGCTIDYYNTSKLSALQRWVNEASGATLNGISSAFSQNMAENHILVQILTYYMFAILGLGGYGYFTEYAADRISGHSLIRHKSAEWILNSLWPIPLSLSVLTAKTGLFALQNSNLFSSKRLHQKAT